MAYDGLHIESLSKWERWIISLEGEKVDAMKDRVLRSAGMRYLEYVDDYTPRRSGRLAGSLSVGAPENVFKVRNTKMVSDVQVGTNVKYAAAVNDGFSQADRIGDFVPGEWRSGTFHYMPGHDEGMILTGAEVEGAFMFDKAMDDMQDDLPRILEFELRRLYEELF